MRQKAEELVVDLRNFADQHIQNAKREHEDARKAVALGKSNTIHVNMANWHEGKAEAFGLAAKWLARDVLGLES